MPIRLLQTPPARVWLSGTGTDRLRIEFIVVLNHDATLQSHFDWIGIDLSHTSHVHFAELTPLIPEPRLPWPRFIRYYIRRVPNKFVNEVIRWDPNVFRIERIRRW